MGNKSRISYLCTTKKNNDAFEYLRIPQHLVCGHPGHTNGRNIHLPGIQVDKRVGGNEYIHRRHPAFRAAGGRGGVQHEVDERPAGNFHRRGRDRAHRHIPARGAALSDEARLALWDGRKSRDFFNKLMGIQDQKMAGGTVNEIAEACRAMSADKTGALIVFPRKDSLDFIVETGDIVDAKVTRRLIMNIFFKNSPLHDGAMIISADRIVAARCTLPITGRSDIPAHYGMRHKAAIGISEETDADVVVVSEETGGISFVRGGNIKSINNINELKLLLGAGEGTTEEKRATEGKQ